MTDLSDFLKCKKVRCVKAYDDCLTVGKEYSVLDIRMEVKVKDDEDDNCYWESDHFEPVLDSAENPLQNIELTPEFEAVEPVLSDNSTNTQDNGVNMQDTPKFKAGDKVYLFGIDYIEEITKIIGANVYLAGADFDASVSIKEICHATQENYERLQATFPDIEFEQPSKPLTGIELAKKLIAKGHNYLVVDTVIGIRVLTRLEGNTLIDSNNVRLDELDDITPLNDETGEPLTQAVLDE